MIIVLKKLFAELLTYNRSYLLAIAPYNRSPAFDIADTRSIINLVYSLKKVRESVCISGQAKSL